MRTAIVTGAYGAIGAAIVKQLAEKDFSVVMLGRDEARLRTLQSTLTAQRSGRHIDYEVVDLSSQKSIGQAAERWNRGPLHVLVNNAAASPPKKQLTSAGLEVQFATNVLGYLWMTNSFLPHLRAAADASPSKSSPAGGANGFGARVIFVASHYASEPVLQDLQFERRPYDNTSSYRQSKACNRMLAVALAERLRPLGISVNSCHPGQVESKLSGDLGFGGMGSKTPEQGADTAAWLAYEPSLSDRTGGYYSDRKLQKCEFSHDKTAVEKLYEICSTIKE